MLAGGLGHPLDSNHVILRMGSGKRLYYIARHKREGQRDLAGFQMVTVRPRIAFVTPCKVAA